MRRRCNGAKFTTESVNVLSKTGPRTVADWTQTNAEIFPRRSALSQHKSAVRPSAGHGRGAFPTAVKVHCEVCWSVGKGECWDE